MSDESKLSPTECVGECDMIMRRQRAINKKDSMIEIISELPNLPGRDIFINELNKDVDRDRKSLSNTITNLENRGCKDARVSLLFA